MLLRKIVAAVSATVVAAIAVPATASAAPAHRPVPAGRHTVATANTTTLSSRNPVIVVAGLSGPAAVYYPLADRLAWDGYDSYVFQLPYLGTGDIRNSAKAFATYVAQVRAYTGAAKVDVVAHSEGGLVSRYYIKNLGGTNTVGRYVSLGTPQYGTYTANIATFLGLGSCLGIVACEQMSLGSSFLADLNAGDDTPGTVRWTTVRTFNDELVQPVDTAKVYDGATNVYLQGYCPLRVVGHVGLVTDGTVYSIIRQALADAAISPNCWAV